MNKKSFKPTKKSSKDVWSPKVEPKTQASPLYKSSNYGKKVRLIYLIISSYRMMIIWSIV